jgi:hypothetical protein
MIGKTLSSSDSIFALRLVAPPSIVYLAASWGADTFLFRKDLWAQGWLAGEKKPHVAVSLAGGDQIVDAHAVGASLAVKRNSSGSIQDHQVRSGAGRVTGWRCFLGSCCRTMRTVCRYCPDIHICAYLLVTS